MDQITGYTRMFGILADPIDHVKTPQRINQLLHARNFDGVMIPVHVSSENLASLSNGLRVMKNLGGFVVTIPHKTAMPALCDELTPTAARVGAVNVVRRTEDGRFLGAMLDGDGFVAGLRSQGIEPRGRTAYLMGAGGAASAIAYSLVDAGVKSLTIANRTASKAQELVNRIQGDMPGVVVRLGSDNPEGHDLVINGTSLGMKEGDPLPLLTDRLTPDQIVCEVIMQPAETALLRAAKHRGCRTHFGAVMLTSQVELMARFMGVPDTGRAAQEGYAA